MLARTLRACWRLGRCVAQLARGMLICAFVFPRMPAPQRMVRVGTWCVQMARILGMEVQASGKPQAGPLLLVANHISWLDILAINAVQPARFVSKADVRSWPLLGWLVGCGGTLFIERERKRDALRVVHQIAEALNAGDTVAMFPEGTTGDGTALLPFHANLLQAAIGAQVPVQAMALRYRDAQSEPSQAVVWVGDMTLARSLWRVVVSDRLCVQVSLLPVLPTAQRERRELSGELRSQIGDALGLAETSMPAH